MRVRMSNAAVEIDAAEDPCQLVFEVLWDRNGDGEFYIENAQVAGEVLGTVTQEQGFATLLRIEHRVNRKVLDIGRADVQSRDEEYEPTGHGGEARSYSPIAPGVLIFVLWQLLHVEGQWYVEFSCHLKLADEEASSAPLIRMPFPDYDPDRVPEAASVTGLPRFEREELI